MRIPYIKRKTHDKHALPFEQFDKCYLEIDVHIENVECVLARSPFYYFIRKLICSLKIQYYLVMETAFFKFY